MTSAKDALELLLCEDKELCRQKAEALTQLNAERKEMTANGVKAAKNISKAPDMQTIRYLLYIFQTVTKVSPELLPEE